MLLNPLPTLAFCFVLFLTCLFENGPFVFKVPSFLLALIFSPFFLFILSRLLGDTVWYNFIYIYRLILSYNWIYLSSGDQFKGIVTMLMWHDFLTWLIYNTWNKCIFPRPCLRFWYTVYVGDICGWGMESCKKPLFLVPLILVPEQAYFPWPLSLTIENYCTRLYFHTLSSQD